MPATMTKPKAKTETKWTREADGSYTFGEFKIRKDESNHRRWPWVLTHPQLMDVGDWHKGEHTFQTLTKAKEGGPRMLADKLAKIRTGIFKEKSQRAAELCKQLRIQDAKEYSPAMGISYLEFFGIRIGTTREAIAAECSKAEAEAVCEELLANVDQNYLVAELDKQGCLDEFEPAAEDRTIFQSGKATIIVEQLYTGKYRVRMIVGFEMYESSEFALETDSPDKMGKAAVKGIDSMTRQDRDTFAEEKILAFAEMPEDDYCPLVGDKWKFTILDSDGNTVDAELFIGDHLTPEQIAKRRESVEQWRAEQAAKQSA